MVSLGGSTRRNSLVELHEVGEGHHEGDLNAAIVANVLHLLHVNVAWVDDSGDLADVDFARGG